MAIFDHWHPMYAASKLGAQPARVRLGGRDIVLFRGQDGQIGALDNMCVHRRMDLSRGCVIDGRLQCTYHGWTYDCAGNGESPGTPKLHAKTNSYDTAIAHDYIWIKRAGAEATLPEFTLLDSFSHVGTLEHVINAPLELVLDNFTEVEHTPTTHANFGYDLSRMHEVETRVEPDESSIRVVNSGPQKKTPWVVAKLSGLRGGDRFVDDWTTYFSPVYTIYNQYWTDPATGEERRDRWRIWVFFNPLDDDRTQLVTFAFLRAPSAGRRAFITLTKPALRALVNLEVNCDVKMLEQLASKDPALEGMKLSRFDRVLGLNRDRIERIYRGNGKHAEVVAQEA